MLDEEFTIKNGQAPNFITLLRVLKWSDKLVEVFIKISKNTDWGNIQDLSISS